MFWVALGTCLNKHFLDSGVNNRGLCVRSVWLCKMLQLLMKQAPGKRTLSTDESPEIPLPSFSVIVFWLLLVK